jgi:hypothetical protein
MRSEAHGESSHRRSSKSADNFAVRFSDRSLNDAGKLDRAGGLRLTIHANVLARARTLAYLIQLLKHRCFVVRAESNLQHTRGHLV